MSAVSLRSIIIIVVVVVLLLSHGCNFITIGVNLIIIIERYFRDLVNNRRGTRKV